MRSLKGPMAFKTTVAAFLAASCGAMGPDPSTPPSGGPETEEPPGDERPEFDPLAREICLDEQDPIPTVTGHLQDPELVETSGVVASWRTPGVLWLHNDSGHPDRIYAAGLDGSALARVELPGVSMADLEDIAAGPCPDGSSPCLWLGDVGDNLHRRDDAAIYVIPEPAIDTDLRDQRLSAERVWRIPVSFPGGPVDVEAMVLTPDGHDIYMWEKIDDAQARIFRLSSPFIDGEAREVEAVGVVASPGVAIRYGRMITGADLHPTGRHLVLRLYTGVFEYDLDGGLSPAELDSAPMRVVAWGPMTEPQGEAVAYDETGKGIWTVSEDPEQQPGQPLHHFPCPPLD